jgi:thiamine kinase-like enzyme
MEKKTMPGVEEIIAQIPGWGNAKNLLVEPLQGLTNTNYAVIVDGEQFVLRISGPNANRLGIDRDLEYQALRMASEKGIAPQVFHCILPQGHLVTRYIHGRHLDLESYRTKENIQRIVRQVKHLHELPAVEAEFSTFQRVELFTSQVQSMGVPLPPGFDEMVKKMEAIKEQQARDSDPWRRFCHNDLFCVNVIDDGRIRFIDWEFAGMGDIYYDLATLTYAYDSVDTLSPALQAYMLECYFGEVKSQNLFRLMGMKYMVMFFSAMWSLLQQGLQEQGLVRSVDGFSFREYAESTFKTMRNFIHE